MNRKIVLNQIGYICSMPKTAAVVGGADSFQIIDIKYGRTMFSGIPKAPVFDPASCDTVSLIDFSAFNVCGDYYIRAGRKKSPIFTISPEPYSKLLKGLIKSFYFSRCGVALDKRFAGEYSHGRCHDELVPLFENPSLKLDVSGGWHDSGGYGRYSPCTSVSAAHMLYAYKLFPESFSESADIPESGGELPDILSECRIGLEWLLKMQTRDGGVYHKIASITSTPMIMPDDDPTKHCVFPRSHKAAACFCAVCALASGIYKPFDAEFSERLYKASLNAWIWLMNNPAFKPFENPPTIAESLAGDFSDESFDDDIFWAVCELYEATGDESFHGRIRELSARVRLTEFKNRENGGFGAMSYIFGSRPKDEHIEQLIQLQLRIKADNLCALSEKSGYGTAKSPDDYVCGSNMYSMTDSMALIFAYKIFNCREYLTAAYEQLNYILGKNPMGMCYVTGFGSNSASHPHHRLSEAAETEEPVPGLLVCGPNNHSQDDFTQWNIPPEAPPAKCYYDVVHSFSTNESAIYCNSAAIFVVGYFCGLF